MTLLPTYMKHQLTLLVKYCGWLRGLYSEVCPVWQLAFDIILACQAWPLSFDIILPSGCRRTQGCQVMQVQTRRSEFRLETQIP